MFVLQYLYTVHVHAYTHTYGGKIFLYVRMLLSILLTYSRSFSHSHSMGGLRIPLHFHLYFFFCFNNIIKSRIQSRMVIGYFFLTFIYNPGSINLLSRSVASFRDRINEFSLSSHTLRKPLRLTGRRLVVPSTTRTCDRTLIYLTSLKGIWLLNIFSCLSKLMLAE